MTDKEIEGLIKRSKRYLRSAKLLLKDEDFASPISRSYYAMFYLAEALLLSKNRSYSSHKAVISGFGQHFVKAAIFKKEFSKMPHQAFEKRQRAEYDYDFAASKGEAELILSQVQKFLKQTQQYLKGKNYINLFFSTPIKEDHK